MFRHIRDCYTGDMRFRLQELREAKGLTQEQIAEKMQISQSLYQGLESGRRRMNATYMESAAEVFGVHPVDLIVDDRPTESIADEVNRRLSRLDSEDQRMVLELADRLSAKAR